MGKKLGQQEMLESIRNSNKFFRECGEQYTVKTAISIIDDNGELIKQFNPISIVIQLSTNRTIININWEDCGLTREEFRKKGLFGNYYSDYTKMKLKNEYLVIKSSDSDKTVYVKVPD